MSIIYRRDMELRSNNTNSYFPDKAVAVQFVNEKLQFLKEGYALITTITPEKSGGCFVTTATVESLDGIVIQTYSSPHTSI